VVQIASKEGISIAAAVKRQKTIKSTVNVSFGCQPKPTVKRQLSVQAETGSRPKKLFEDLRMDKFLAGNDGAESGTPPPLTHSTIKDEAIRMMIRRFHSSSPPEVSKPAEPVKPVGKGKNKK